MKQKNFLISVFFMVSILCHGQLKIGGNISTAPQSFSLLEIESTSGGLRLPQLTEAQIGDITNYLTDATTSADTKKQALGLVVFNTTANRAEIWRGGPVFLPFHTTDCTPASSVTITANADTLTEYGPSDLLLTADAADASFNADVIYTWYHNDEPIASGKTFQVKKEDLDAKWAGTYKVQALSCASGEIKTVHSEHQTIVINKARNISVDKTSFLVDPDNPDTVIIMATIAPNGPAPPAVFIESDADRMFRSSNITQEGDRYKISISIYPSGSKDSRNVKIRVIDNLGTQSDLITISQTQDFSARDYPLHATIYHIHNRIVSKPLTYEEAYDFCRSLTWNSPRSSLIPEFLLRQNVLAFSSEQNLIPEGKYWLASKSTGQPVVGEVSYPDGTLKLVISLDSPPGPHLVKCIVPVN